MTLNISKQLGLGIMPSELPVPNLNYQLGFGNGGYLSMIGDAFIDPKKRTYRLDEWYFNERAIKVAGNPNTKISAKKILEDKSSELYFNPIFNSDLSLDALKEKVKIAEEKAVQRLETAKSIRQNAIDALGKRVDVTKKTARERVDRAIARGGIDDTLKTEDVKRMVMQSINAITYFVIFFTVADAYKNEIEQREDKSRKINDALKGEDIKKLQDILPLAATLEQKNQISQRILFLQDSLKRKNSIDQFTKNLGEAKTDEERRAIEAAIKLVKDEESIAQGNAPATDSKPNYLLIGGICAAIILGIFLIKRN